MSLSYYRDIPLIALVVFVLNPMQKLKGLFSNLYNYHKILGFIGNMELESQPMSGL